jgi:FkbM family methyltransferase
MPERFHVHACALGAKAEVRWLAFNPKIPQHATLCEHIEAIEYLNNKERVAVTVKTLDQIWLQSGPAERLDFIKIDSEGWERDILDGAHETLRRTQPKAIQLEFNRHHLMRGQTLLSIAKRLENYTLFQLLPNRIEPRDPTTTLANIFQYSNFAFIHQDQLDRIEDVLARGGQQL